MALKLVDVNSDSVSETWPLLLDSVEKAHFIALDLVTDKLFCSASKTLYYDVPLQELSGLGNILTQGGGL